MSLIKIILISFGVGFMLSLISVIFALDILSSSSTPSLISEILFWNIFLAMHLIKTGILPACENCELAILLYIIFYGFIIGLAGYFSVSFSVISFIDQRENRKRRSKDIRQNIVKFPF